MAVQKSRVTRSKRGMRRAHDHLIKSMTISFDITTGEAHRRHRITKDGFYRGQQMIQIKRKEKSSKEESE